MQMYPFLWTVPTVDLIRLLGGRIFHVKIPVSQS